MNTDQPASTRWRASGFLRIHEPFVPGVPGGAYLEGEEAERVAAQVLDEGEVWVVTSVHPSGRRDGVRFVTLAFGAVKLTRATLAAIHASEGGSYA